MPTCPYCEGDVSSTARKCKHCGEWLKEAGRPTPDAAGQSIRQIFGEGEDSLGRAANRQVSWNQTIGVVTLVIMVLVILFVFVPIACKFNQGPSFPSGVPNFQP